MCPICFILIDKLGVIHSPALKVSNEYFATNISISFCTITVTNSVFIQSGSGKDRTVIDCCNTVLNLMDHQYLKILKVKLTVL